MLCAPPDLSSLEIPDSWLELAERLPQRGRIAILGAADAGKTSFAWWLAEELSSAGPVVLVDADLGQSRVGPPASVGWVHYGTDRGEFEFVGDVSPASRPAATIAAVARMTARAQRMVKPQWVILDTTGYVDGLGALQLKTAKLQLLAPVTVVAIGPPGRLEHLRWPWRGRQEVCWLKMEPAAGCEQKEIERRQAWRRELFAAWLEGAENTEYELDHLALHHVPPPSALERLGPQGLQGLLVGLDDAQGVGLGLGLLEELDLSRNYVRVLAPPYTRQARGLRLGNIRLNPDGSQREEGTPWRNNS
ncbi:MAG: Clp1/GlmU family protein [Armatimonadetes bacterium]|nr:Clp1/GlmU family protein [Armatimonadota bacterium]